jgi:hypothetical protein
MRFSLCTIAGFFLIAATWSQATQGAEVVIGTWEGESTCALPDSPCHDERALYRIAVDKRDPQQLILDGYKVINGSPEFMGSLVCRDQSERATLSCTGGKQDDWEFQVSSDRMAGTLTIGTEKQVYRRITLSKSPSKAS